MSILKKSNHVDVKFTFLIPYNTPRNGVCYTKEAIEDAIMHIGSIPIVNSSLGILGLACHPAYSNAENVEWDDENQQCRITIGGCLYNANAEIYPREIVDGKITSMEIVGFSLNELKEPTND